MHSRGTLFADLIATMPQARDKPVWLSFTLQDHDFIKGGADMVPHLRSGETVGALLSALDHIRYDALLFNCSQVEEMEHALKLLRDKAFGLPYGAYANAFAPIKLGSDEHAANETITKIRDDLSYPRKTI